MSDKSKLRARMAEEYVQFINSQICAHSTDNQDEEMTVDKVKFTCDDCPLAIKCPFAFDTYNMNGDCLADK